MLNREGEEKDDHYNNRLMGCGMEEPFTGFDVEKLRLNSSIG